MFLENDEVGVATVYRVLNQFVDAGNLESSRFDFFIGIHNIYLIVSPLNFKLIVFSH